MIATTASDAPPPSDEAEKRFEEIEQAFASGQLNRNPQFNSDRKKIAGRSLPALIETLRKGTEGEKVAAIELIGNLFEDGNAAAAAVKSALRSDSESKIVRMEALWCLVKISTLDVEMMDWLRQCIRLEGDDSSHFRTAGILISCQYAHIATRLAPDYLAFLTNTGTLREAYIMERSEILRALTKVSLSKDASSVLVDIVLNDREFTIRAAACKLLRQCPGGDNKANTDNLLTCLTTTVDSEFLAREVALTLAHVQGKNRTIADLDAIANAARRRLTVRAAHLRAAIEAVQALP